MLAFSSAGIHAPRGSRCSYSSAVAVPPPVTTAGERHDAAAAAFVRVAVVGCAFLTKQRRGAATRQHRCSQIGRRGMLVRRIEATVKDVVPDEMLTGKYGKEVEVCVEALVESMHVANMVSLLMEAKKDKSARGLHGFEMERLFVRLQSTGEPTTIAHVALMASVCRHLLEHFPDIPILCDQSGDVLDDDEDFADTVASFLRDFKIIPEATPESCTAWVRHAGSYPKGKEPPKRYWAFSPVDTTYTFRTGKQYSCMLALFEDGEPVVSGMACPVMSFNHASRERRAAMGSPVFFAVKGQGAYTQQVYMPRDGGIYLGKYRLRGPAERLNVNEKIKREKDDLYDALGSDQLFIAMPMHDAEDVFHDAQRLGVLLGSKYPMFDMIDSATKFARLARGEHDVVWYMTGGLYDKGGRQSLVHHAPGALICAEAGAVVADLDGNPIQWCGPVLEKNRGFAVVDPNRLPMPGLVSAVNNATVTSEEEYEKRMEKKREVKAFLKSFFERLVENAETDEERLGAARAMEKGKILLAEGDDELDEITWDRIHREKPMLGERKMQPGEDAFRGDATFSPIKI